MIAWLAVFACGAPVSNATFYADSEFVAGLPAKTELAMPESLLAAPPGPDAVLVESQTQADLGTDRLAALIAATEALRAAPPSERSEVHRAWTGVTAAWSTPDGVAIGWISASIIRPDGGASTIAISGAASVEGPYMPIAEGTWSKETGGELLWDVRAAADAFGESGDGALTVTWTGDIRANREVTVAYAGAAAIDTWGLIGDSVLVWDGDLGITADGLVWPGWATVVHQFDAGGRAAGEIVTDAGVKPFGACWSPTGEPVWRGGDPSLSPIGAESACGIPAFSD